MTFAVNFSSCLLIVLSYLQSWKNGPRPSVTGEARGEYFAMQWNEQTSNSKIILLANKNQNNSNLNLVFFMQRYPFTTLAKFSE